MGGGGELGGQSPHTHTPGGKKGEKREREREQKKKKKKRKKKKRGKNPLQIEEVISRFLRGMTSCRHRWTC